MNRPSVKRVPFLIAALSALPAASCLTSSGSQPVQLAEVRLSDLKMSIDTNGQVEAGQLFELRAPFSGRCLRISAREGALLRRGEAVAVMDDSTLRSELSVARAELVAAEVDLRDIHRAASREEVNRAESEVVRWRYEVESSRKIAETNESLLGKGAISKFEYEESRRALARAEQALSAAMTQREDLGRRYEELDRRRAESRLAAARARVSHLESAVERSVIRAPADGTLYEFNVKDGAFLNAGELVGALADLSTIRVRAFVDEPEMGRLKQGNEVLVRWDALPQESWSGKVTRLPSRVVARGTRSVGEVLCSLSDPKQVLIPNINVDVEILMEQGPQVPCLPRNTVFPEGRGYFVWVIRDGVAGKRPIQTGRSTSSLIEVTGGLGLGERVIVPGEVTVSEGMKVRARE